jgi:4-hydroxy-tetrahydrodipicolinate reductase
LILVFPAVAVSNISSCFHENVPVISGTTGWLEHYDEMVHFAKKKMAPLFLVLILV